MTVEELLGRTSSRELSEWEAFYQLEPFGVQRDNLHFAMLCQLICNMMIPGNNSKMDEFMLDQEKTEDQGMTTGQMFLTMQMFANKANAKG